MIRLDGWRRFSIWEHSSIVRELYRRRARDEAEEMTCAAQAAELLAQLAKPGESLLDAGCGSGYFFHSLRRRALALEYWGIDATARFIEIGQAEISRFGLPPERLQVGRIEDLDGSIDHVLCMNVLSNLDNFHRPLERLLRIARKSVVLRESVRDAPEYSYVEDHYLDADEPLRVHVNTYARSDVAILARELGFETEEYLDRRSGGEAEMVIGHPHFWTFLVFRRVKESA